MYIEIPWGLVKRQVLMQQVGGGTWDSAFLTNSQVMLMLLLPDPHLNGTGVAPTLNGMHNDPRSPLQRLVTTAFSR